MKFNQFVKEMIYSANIFSAILADGMQVPRDNEFEKLVSEMIRIAKKLKPKHGVEDWEKHKSLITDLGSKMYISKCKLLLQKYDEKKVYRYFALFGEILHLWAKLGNKSSKFY